MCVYRVVLFSNKNLFLCKDRDNITSWFTSSSCKKDEWNESILRNLLSDYGESVSVFNVRTLTPVLE